MKIAAVVIAAVIVGTGVAQARPSTNGEITVRENNRYMQYEKAYPPNRGWSTTVTITGQYELRPATTPTGETRIVVHWNTEGPHAIDINTNLTAR